MKYISDGTWFKKGTEVKLIDDYRPEGLNMGLFEGIRVTEYESELAILGEERIDQEVCGFDEFEELP